jgi:predicted phosphodiesterase
MLAAIISDLHLRHWQKPPWTGYLEASVFDQIKERGPDVVLDAGDWEIAALHERIRDELGIPVVETWGNHDYFGLEWPGPANEGSVVRLGGLPPIIRAPLWTDFKNDDPVTHIIVRNGLIDARLIKGYTTEKVLEAHYAQRDYIKLVSLENPGAIILTHHAPSWKSVHEVYQNDLLSWGFVSDMDHIVEASHAKLWVHGHTHTPHDYVIGETRVVCNPCGYPHELRGVYEPLYVEI